MALLYINEDYEKSYNCSYKVEEDEIYIETDYHSNNIWYSENIKDTVIVEDTINNKKIFIKQGIVQGILNKTIYRSIEYVITKTNDNIYKLGKTNKIIINFEKYPTRPNYNIEEVEENTSIVDFKFNKKLEVNTININKNNIEKINCIEKCKKKIEIILINAIEYTEVYEYIRELVIFLQLFKYRGFKINKIFIEIDGKKLEISNKLLDLKYEMNHKYSLTNVKIYEFLESCYKNLEYRSNKNEVRSIPYIILRPNSNIEDRFLLYFRYIEFYYKNNKNFNLFYEKENTKYQKKQNIKNKKDLNVNKTIYKYIYEKTNFLKKYQSRKNINEIITLRNHFVHQGYHIPNNILKKQWKENNMIKEKTISENADINFIVEKTDMLYKIVMHIIFKEILGYSNYTYDYGLINKLY